MILKYKLFESSSRVESFLEEHGTDYSEVYSQLRKDDDFMAEILKTGKITFYNLEMAFRRPVRYNHPKSFKVMLEDLKLDPSLDENLFNMVCSRNRVDMLNMLLDDGQGNLTLPKGELWMYDQLHDMAPGGIDVNDLKKGMYILSWP